MAKNMSVYTALGAAIGYYGVYADFQRLWLFLLVLVFVSSFLRVLSLTHSFRSCNIYFTAFVLGFCLGLGTGYSSPVKLGLHEERITAVYGTLEDDPRGIAGGRGMGSVIIQQVSGKDGLRVSAQGKILVFFPEETVPRLKEFGRGSKVYIGGRFNNNNPNNTLNTLNNIFRAESVHITESAGKTERFRTSLRLNMMSLYEGEAWGGLALALILGAKDYLDAGFAKYYLYAGASHVLALSGMHLAIVAAIIAFLLKKALGLKTAATIGMLCILAYVYLVGNLPSLTRAAIMYSLGTLAVLGTLPKNSANLLSLAFLIQLCLQPEAGRSPAFILSYSALAGILSVGRYIHELLEGKLPETLAQTLAASLGAFIATASIVVIFFGVLRPVGIISGLIIVPLTMLFMITAIADMVLYICFPFLPRITRVFLSLLYDILEKLASLCAEVPGIEIDPLLVFFASLGLAILCFLVCKRRNILNLAPFD